MSNNVLGIKSSCNLPNKNKLSTTKVIIFNYKRITQLLSMDYFK